MACIGQSFGDLIDNLKNVAIEDIDELKDMGSSIVLNTDVSVESNNPLLIFESLDIIEESSILLVVFRSHQVEILNLQLLGNIVLKLVLVIVKLIVESYIISVILSNEALNEIILVLLGEGLLSWIVIGISSLNNVGDLLD